MGWRSSDEEKIVFSGQNLKHLLILLTFILIGIFIIGFGSNSLAGLITQEKLTLFLLADCFRAAFIFLYVYLIKKYIYKKSVKALFLSDRISHEMLMGLFLGSFMILSVYAICKLTNSMTQIWPERIDQFTNLIVTVILTSLTTAFWEELIMRGLLLDELLTKFNSKTSLLISASFFGIAHLLGPTPSILTVLSTFLAGLLLGLIYLKTKNLYFPIALHFSWNCLQQLLFSKKIFQTEIKNSLLAGSVTVEDGLIAINITALAVLIIYNYYRGTQKITL